MSWKYNTVDEDLDRLNRAGWTIGDTAFRDGAGGLIWIVTCRNDENLIRAEGTTRPAPSRGVGQGGG